MTSLSNDAGEWIRICFAKSWIHTLSRLSPLWHNNHGEHLFFDMQVELKIQLHHAYIRRATVQSSMEHSVDICRYNLNNQKSLDGWPHRGPSDLRLLVTNFVKPSQKHIAMPPRASNFSGLLKAACCAATSQILWPFSDEGEVEMFCPVKSLHRSVWWVWNWTSQMLGFMSYCQENSCLLKKLLWGIWLSGRRQSQKSPPEAQLWQVVVFLPFLRS